jgi:MFS family permease
MDWKNSCAVGALVIGLAAGQQVWAQAAAEPAHGVDGAAPATADKGGEIIVTGSRIARRDYTSSSPISTVSSDFIAKTDSSTLETSLNQLPQIASSASSSTNTQARGGQASLNLRGLGQQLRVSLVAVLLSLPFMAGFVFVREIQLALVCAGVMNLLLSAAIPPIMNYAIGLVGPRERGITATVVIILMGLVGGALGPAVVGAISDGWQAEHGAQALRYGLAAMLVSPIIAGSIIASVLRTGDVRI